MVTGSTVIDLLQRRAVEEPARPAYTLLADGETEGPSLSWAELDLRARAIGARLAALGARGRSVLLLHPAGLGFLEAFFGSLYAGAIAVPAPPPDPARSARTLARVRAIAADARPVAALASPEVVALAGEGLPEAPELARLQWLVTEEVPGELAEGWSPPGLGPGALAYLQYTSGSTAFPKGVMVSHENVVRNSAYIQESWGYGRDSVSVMWVPNYHDDGLVHGIVQPLYSGFHARLSPPVSLVQRPASWLRAITRYRATHSGGPNFAYALATRKVSEEERRELDLSSWAVAYNAAEPVRRETLAEFTAAFGPCGFRWESFFPSYGLAEATLLVTTRSLAAPPSLLALDASALERDQRVVEVEETAGGRWAVGCGRPVRDTEVAIVDPATSRPRAPDEVGEIWLAGPAIASGYWKRPEDTRETFGAHLSSGAGPFLRTGDLGFLLAGELYVTGRLKDLIIVRGRNLYPQDLEVAAEGSHPALRPGCGAAFSILAGGEERVVVVHEVVARADLDLAEVAGCIRGAVGEHHDVQVHDVVLIAPRSLPKTSSGKVQRQACRQAYLEGRLEAVGPAPHEPVVLAEDGLRPGADAEASRRRADELVEWLRGWAGERLNSRLIDERRSIPPYVVLDLGNRGLFGLQVAESDGGLGLRTPDSVRVYQQLGAIDLTLATLVTGHNTLGLRPIQRFAREPLRGALLPALAAGRELAAFALTEPGAGSNPRAITARGVPDGRGGWRLYGSKVWSGSAGWAGLINVFVQLEDGAGQPLGITGFALRQGTPGLRMGPEALTMGLRGMVQNALTLDGTAVGAELLLGEPGRGLEAGQDAMMFARLVLGALAVGGMKRCAQLMVRYAERRTIGTGRLLDNPVTLARLSELTAATEALEALVAYTAERVEAAPRQPMELLLACKLLGSELLWQAADGLVQLLGGRGYVETNPAARILRDARLFRIFEGPTETLTMFLGATAASGAEELRRTLAETLAAPDLWERLGALSERLLAAPAGRFADRATAWRWAHSRLGEVAAWALLAAAVRAELGRTPGGRLRRAAEWAEARFERAAAEALVPTPAEAVLLGAAELSGLVAGFGASIGDVEQALAGEEIEPDPLLRRDPARPAAAATAPETAPAPAPDGGAAGEPIRDWLVGWIARHSGREPAAIEVDRPFAFFGLDSITGVELANDLGAWLGRPLSPTLAWAHPTIAAMARHLSGGERETAPASGAPGRQDGEIEALLAELEQLSDEEARRALEREEHLSDHGRSQ